MAERSVDARRNKKECPTQLPEGARPESFGSRHPSLGLFWSSRYGYRRHRANAVRQQSDFLEELLSGKCDQRHCNDQRCNSDSKISLPPPRLVNDELYE